MTKDRNQEKFLNLYEPVHDQFERFCRARVYGRMEYTDLMNESLLIAFQKMGALKSDRSFLSFLIGISVRILANDHRKKKETTFTTMEDFDHVDPNSVTDKNTEVFLLHKALALLPAHQRECLILFEISGFSIKEIVEIQGATASAVKQRLKRGREKLTELLTFESKYHKKEVNHGTR